MYNLRHKIRTCTCARACRINAHFIFFYIFYMFWHLCAMERPLHVPTSASQSLLNNRAIEYCIVFTYPLWASAIWCAGSLPETTPRHWWLRVWHARTLCIQQTNKKKDALIQLQLRCGGFVNEKTRNKQTHQPGETHATFTPLLITTSAPLITTWHMKRGSEGWRNLNDL